MLAACSVLQPSVHHSSSRHMQAMHASSHKHHCAACRCRQCKHGTNCLWSAAAALSACRFPSRRCHFVWFSTSRWRQQQRRWGHQCQQRGWRYRGSGRCLRQQQEQRARLDAGRTACAPGGCGGAQAALVVDARLDEEPAPGYAGPATSGTACLTCVSGTCAAHHSTVVLLMASMQPYKAAAVMPC